MTNDISTLECATPNGANMEKLPLPPRRNVKPVARTATAEELADTARRTQEAKTLDPKKDGIPLSLQVQNRVPLTPEQQAAFDAKAKAAVEAQRPAGKVEDPETAKLKAELDEKKKAKTSNRIAKLKASKDGSAKAMPLSGKDAVKAISKAPNGVVVGETVMPAPKASLKQATSAPGKDRGAPKKAKAGKAAPKKKAASKASNGNGTKLDMVAKLLQRKEGCTTADALKTTGWPSISFNQQAKAAGLTLRKKKEGRITRYWAS